MKINNPKDLVKKIIIGTFVSIPFLSSIISTIHLIDLFKLGNLYWMSIVLAIAFELGSIASLLTLTILDKIKKGMVMSIFIILVFFQLMGNIYYSFDYVNQHLKSDPNWLGSFQELISYFVSGDLILMKIVISCLIGGIIPLISLFFLKSVVDYLKFDENETKISIQQDNIYNGEINNNPNFINKVDSIRDVMISPEFKEQPTSEVDEQVTDIQVENDIVSIDELVPDIKQNNSNVAVYQNNNAS